MSTERQFSQGVAWMAIGGWTEQAFNFAIFVVLARILGAEAFGLLAMAAAFVVLSEFLVRDTLSEYIIADDAPDPDDLNAVFWMLAGLGIALVAALVSAAPWIARFYGDPQIGDLMSALSPTVALVALTAVPVALLRREMQFRILALRAVAGVLAGGIVGLGLAMAGAGVWALVGQRLTVVGVNVVLAWGASDFRPGWVRQPDPNRRRRIMAFGYPVLSLRAAELATVQVPTLILGAVAGPVATGYYAYSWRLVEAASMLIVTPLRMVSQPAFASLRRAEGSANALLDDLARLASLLAFPAFTGLAVLSAAFLAVVGGANWIAAAPLLSALAIVGARSVVVQVEQSFCLAHGRVTPLAVTAWAEVCLIALAMALAAPYGAASMTWAMTGVLLLMWGVRIAIVARVADLRPRVLLRRYIDAAALAALVGVALALWCRVAAAWSPLAVLLSGGLIGAAACAALARVLLPQSLAVARRYTLQAKRRGPTARAAPDLPAPDLPAPPTTSGDAS
ncbi:oligosaccharide flippase family protein [Salipiger sp. PrR002]|uniref:oligosaccharide flippase family protein n=1 Tax=Salipiger sp. PrR002 TaxID=2706489 RepID=UPI0013BB8045|nr:oligosaccharide flippase family protein [Salipiger sp. PrR002]NDV99595.1 oligosaccharide flippase family protein [Salipiger sp. PrR002]NDW57241.1 oligosaccharide flippase family protein [Salipiger sp. PrR004]